jgi:hypothetical protein
MIEVLKVRSEEAAEPRLRDRLVRRVRVRRMPFAGFSSSL